MTDQKHDPECAFNTVLLGPTYQKCDCSLSRYATREDPYGRKEPPPMPAHVERMQGELKELVTRFNKLGVFIHGTGVADGPQFLTLSHTEQKLMLEQHQVMEQYARILSLRYFTALLEREA